VAKPGRANQLPRLPEIDFPIYGLSSRFTASRSLGQWAGLDEGSASEGSVVTVPLIHTIAPPGATTSPRPDVLVTIYTVAKLSAGRTNACAVDQAATASLFGLVQILSVDYSGSNRDACFADRVAEMAHLSFDFEPLDGRRVILRVTGRTIGALSCGIGRAWALMLDLDKLVAVGASGYGIEPSDCDLVRITDPSQYCIRY